MQDSRTIKAMYNSIILILIQVTATFQSHLNYDDVEDRPCVTVQNGIHVNGSCSTIHNCPSILSNVLNQIYNHTVCGYTEGTQFICCPNTELHKIEKLNLNADCKVANSNEIGLIRFLSQCPELNTNDFVAQDHINKLCDYEICADLVCCPLVTLKNRLKKVCSIVGDPIDRLKMRLLQNQECIVKELNMKGRYQQLCEYAQRNPHLIPLLQNVCNHDACRGWYCCPIEDVDHIQCTENKMSTLTTTLVGPRCIDSRSGRKGTCRINFWNYEDAVVDGRIVLDRCGSHCCHEYYCCPDRDLPVNPSIPAKGIACLRKLYLNKEEIEISMDSDTLINRTRCDLKVHLQVAGGIGTTPGEFPNMAALGYESNRTILWNCGGSLISDRYVLTAAHCLINKIGHVKRVRLGVVNLLNNAETADCPEEYGVANQIPHPEYTPLHSYNDIGLIELDGRVKFNYHIRPICLPTNSDIPKHFVSMGWGATGSQNEKSVTLLKVHQTLFTHENCNEFYRHYPIRKINKGILNETQICAGSRFSIQSTCNGDSGGPLLGQNRYYPQTFEIYGIVSTGLSCGFANSPGIYTKVYPYVNWIEEVVLNS